MQIKWKYVKMLWYFLQIKRKYLGQNEECKAFSWKSAFNVNLFIVMS